MESWMQERSKHQYHDENGDGFTPSPPMPCRDIMVCILLIPLLIYYFLMPLVAPFILGFYEIAHSTYKDYHVEYPNLAFIGVIIAFTIIVFNKNQIFNVSNHLFITFCLLLVPVFFTLAPLTGLVLRFIKELFNPE